MAQVHLELHGFEFSVWEYLDFHVTVIVYMCHTVFRLPIKAEMRWSAVSGYSRLYWVICGTLLFFSSFFSSRSPLASYFLLDISDSYFYLYYLAYYSDFNFHHYYSLDQNSHFLNNLIIILVSLPGEFHGQRSLEGYSPWDHRVGHDWVTNTFTFHYLSKYPISNLSLLKTVIEVQRV